MSLSRSKSYIIVGGRLCGPYLGATFDHFRFFTNCSILVCNHSNLASRLSKGYNLPNHFVLVLSHKRGDEWSIKIVNCSQNFTFARFALKI